MHSDSKKRRSHQHPTILFLLHVTALIINDDFEEALKAFESIVCTTHHLTRQQKLQHQSILDNLLRS